MMNNPNFSSGPCSKRPDWNVEVLRGALVGRSHRSAPGKEKLLTAIKESKKILGVPDDYLLGIVPGSDTGAFEMALWAVLGSRPVTVLVWESFGNGWATDVAKQLKLNPTILKEDYGAIPDLAKVDWSNDVVFVANGTTSGVKVPGWDWIPNDRKGLSLCDATSAAFAMAIDWSKVDITTYSWQKCLGGEAAHGIIILSPRAVERIESYDPPWPLPKVFRLKKGDKLEKGLFDGNTINTPSMICVEDYLDALQWAGEIGLQGLINRSMENLKVVEEWVARTDWIEFLAESEEIRSNTSVCLKVTSDPFKAMTKDSQSKFIKDIAGQLSRENIAHDIGSYRDAPPGFRLWCGPTIQPSDVKTVIEGLERVYSEKIKNV
jgi:phosphoserine aminotransferase